GTCKRSSSEAQSCPGPCFDSLRGTYSAARGLVGRAHAVPHLASERHVRVIIDGLDLDQLAVDDLEHQVRPDGVAAGQVQDHAVGVADDADHELRVDGAVGGFDPHSHCSASRRHSLMTLVPCMMVMPVMPKRSNSMPARSRLEIPLRFNP